MTVDHSSKTITNNSGNTSTSSMNDGHNSSSNNDTASQYEKKYTSDQSEDHDRRRRKLSPKSEDAEGQQQRQQPQQQELLVQGTLVGEEDSDEFEVGDILADCGFSLEPADDQEPTMTVLPDPSIPNVCPEKFLLELIVATCPTFKNVQVQKGRSPQMHSFWSHVTDEQVLAYNTQVVTACRTNDLEALRTLQNDGQRLDCFNRFGESLLTMACRRGFESIVQYLLELDQSPSILRSCDDNGRTALHDACWNPSPQLKICQWIMEREPALWLVSDNRGCSPFQYARPEHWDVWRHFLMDNRHCLLRLQNDPDVVAHFIGAAAKTTATSTKQEEAAAATKAIG